MKEKSTVEFLPLLLWLLRRGYGDDGTSFPWGFRESTLAFTERRDSVLFQCQIPLSRHPDAERGSDASYKNKGSQANYEQYEIIPSSITAGVTEVCIEKSEELK